MSANYSAEQRKEIARAFRAAQQYLRRRNEYICIVLRYDVEVGDPEAAIDVIQSRMGPHPFPNCFALEHWLARRLDLPESYFGSRQEDMRRYRIRWLNALIKEFES